MDDFYKFLRNPILYPTFSKPTIYQFIRLLFFYLPFVMLFAFISYILTLVFNITHDTIDYSYVKKIIFGFLLAPIYEEIIFRSLLKFNRTTVALFMFTLVVFLVLAIVKGVTSYLYIVSVLLLIITMIITFFPIASTSAFVERNIKYFVYGSSFLFGVIHAGNFTGNGWILFAFSFILGGPQIVAGLIMSYLRLKYGLQYSILFHMIMNASILLSF